MEEGGIKLTRSDGLSHSMPSAVLRNMNLTGAHGKERCRADSHVEGALDHIKVSRSDGVTQDLLSMLKISGSRDEASVAVSSQTKTAPPPRTLSQRSMSMASIFGNRSKSQPSPLSKIQIMSIPESIPDSTFHPADVRLVHMSNTRALLDKNGSTAFLPKGDVLVHSGDFTRGGSDEEFAQFDAWLRSVKFLYHYRVVVLGMRDVMRYGADWEVMRSLLPNATHVLCHEEATVMGLRIYGCPWSWGHGAKYSVRIDAPPNTSGGFDGVPDGIHVLVSHGAAYGRLDCTEQSDSEEHAGSRELAEALGRARPGLHLHGHVCSGRGVQHAFGAYPLSVNSCMVHDRDPAVLYATAHVVQGTKLFSDAQNSSWSFSIAPLET